ncbi:MAG: TIGR04028 family ABC transporter substrate-binding protein [Bifidobacteriaceae bacterium]|jgi:peptide/nickel transport system substrate-binding protein|nr:TIGR04028 family ABC transporter substrate-binding protein [Bifidobacteriaceae bacterium]
MTRIRPSAATAAVVLTAFTLTACGGQNAPTGDGASGSSPVQGGQLVFLESQFPTCFYAGGSGYYPVATLLNILGDKLTFQDPQTREISPWLATAWEINPDATEYTFTLRDDVTFSDGTPLTASVVALNFDHFGQGDEDLGLSAQEFVSNYVRSEVVDDQTVKFYFSQPSPGFLQATAVVGAAIMAEKTAKLPYEDQCQLKNLVASGPFTFESEVPEQEYTLTARQDYDWAPKVSQHQGRAYLDSVKVVVTPENNVRVGALTSGQAHAVRAVDVYDVPALEAAGQTVHYAPTNGVNPQYALRPAHRLLADKRVRQALIKATDSAALAETIYQGRFKRATSVLSSGATGYVDLSTALEYDPDEARRLLEEAGWEVGPDGFRTKDGETLELTTWVGAVFPQNQQLNELVAKQWEEVGVKLLVDTPDAATATAGQRDPQQLPVAITHVGRVDPDVLKSDFHSESARNALAFTAETADPQLDQLLEDLSTKTTNEEREQQAEAVQRYIIEEQAYTVPLYELPQTYATAPGVHGLAWEPVGRVRLYDVWFEQ